MKSKHGTKLEKICELCLKSFKDVPWIAKNKKFCSKSCISNAIKSRARINISCLNCNLVFSKTISRKQTFCSRKCYWQKKKTLPENNCLDCKKEITPSLVVKRCHPCAMKLFSGNKHWAWKVDRSLLKKKEQRNDSAYKEWRKNVWLRDNFTCKIANPDCLGRIEAHHILVWSEYPELRYEINNGITLCHAHHPRKKSEEKRLSPYFQELVSVSKKTI